MRQIKTKLMGEKEKIQFSPISQYDMLLGYHFHNFSLG